MRSRGPVCARRRRVRRPACVAIRVCAGCRAEVLCPAVRVCPPGWLPPQLCVWGAVARPSEGLCAGVCAWVVCPGVGSPPSPPPRVSVFARLAALDVCVRIGCPSQGLCSRVCPLGCPFVCVCLRVVCLQGCVSVRPCQVPGGRGELGLSALWGLRVGLGEGSLPLPWSMSTVGGSSAVLGGDGHVFPFLVAGGGGWAAGRWTDGGMRGRGVDRWA